MLFQYYKEIFGFDVGFLYDVAFGVLLRDDLHHAFDRGWIAFWPTVRACGFSTPSALFYHIAHIMILPRETKPLPLLSSTCSARHRTKSVLIMAK